MIKDLKIKVDRRAAVPLYHQIERQFSQMISSKKLRAGDQLPGVPQLTREFNINQRTIRQAYQRLAQEGLVKTVKGRGTFVADTNGGVETKSVEFLSLHPIEDEDRSYFARGIYRGMMLEAQECNWSCTSRTIDPVSGLADQLGRAGGYIAMASNNVMQAMLDYLSGNNYCGITVGGSGSKFPNVVADDYQGISLLMNHLYELGHRRIAIIDETFSKMFAHNRFDAYCRIMSQKGLDINASWIYMTDNWSLGSVADQENVFSRMFGCERPPTAVIACTAYLALSTLQMLHRHKIRIPDEVSVCGYDDPQPMAFSWPALTTIRQPVEEIGRTAMRKLTAKMEGKEAENQVLPVELIVRDSTGPVCDNGKV